jgi:hypothetical protein
MLGAAFASTFYMHSVSVNIYILLLFEFLTSLFCSFVCFSLSFLIFYLLFLLSLPIICRHAVFMHDNKLIELLLLLLLLLLLPPSFSRR